jgi:hypothetical protein
MIRVEWPRIRAEIDAGRLAMLGLVRVVSLDPMELSKNHQVIAYGYDTDGTTVTLHVADPNWAHDDGVTLAFDTADPKGVVKPKWSRPDTPPVCFFMAPYASRDPVPFRAP